MTDSSKGGGSSIFRGDFITREEAERMERNIRTAQQHGLSEGLALRISGFRWQIRAFIKKLEEVDRLLEMETKVMTTYYNHQLATQRLRNVHKHAEDQEKIRGLQDAITITELENRFNELKGMSGNGGEERVEAIVKKGRIEAEIKKTIVKQKIELRRDLRQERDQAIRDITGDGKGKLTEEQQQEIDDIKDIYQRLLDDL